MSSCYYDYKIAKYQSDFAGHPLAQGNFNKEIFLETNPRLILLHTFLTGNTDKHLKLVWHAADLGNSAAMIYLHMNDPENFAEYIKGVLTGSYPEQIRKIHKVIYFTDTEKLVKLGSYYYINWISLNYHREFLTIIDEIRGNSDNIPIKTIAKLHPRYLFGGNYYDRFTKAAEQGCFRCKLKLLQDGDASQLSDILDGNYSLKLKQQAAKIYLSDCCTGEPSEEYIDEVEKTIYNLVKYRKFFDPEEWGERQRQLAHFWLGREKRIISQFRELFHDISIVLGTTDNLVSRVLTVLYREVKTWHCEPVYYEICYW